MAGFANLFAGGASITCNLLMNHSGRTSSSKQSPPALTFVAEFLPGHDCASVFFVGCGWRVDFDAGGAPRLTDSIPSPRIHASMMVG
jgi:hypothetical protein